MVAPTSSRVTGLSSPPVWTSVVQVSLFGVLMLVVMQEKSSVSYKKPLFLTILPFMTIRVHIKEWRFIFLHSGSYKKPLFLTRALLLHTCYSVNGHVLETCYMGWSDRIVAYIH